MGRILKLIVILLTTQISLFAISEESERVSVNQYWEEVKRNNEGIAGALQTIEGLEKRKNESDLLTTHALFFQTQSIDDRSLKSNPTMMGKRTEGVTYSLGVQAQHTFGLQSKLYYSLGHWNTEGASSNFLPVPNYHEARSTLELVMPFWRNRFGSEIQPQIVVAKNISLANINSEKFRIQLFQVEAESIYWRLAFAQKAVEVQRSSVLRAQKIAEWNQKKFNAKLADKSDFLQSDALVKVRKIELKAAEDDLRSARLVFNSMRSVGDNDKGLVLDDLENSPVIENQIKGVGGNRLDVKAALFQKEATMASSELIKEKNTPQLDLYGSLSWNGRDQSQSSAQDDSFRSTYPTQIIGVKFVMPLDLELLKNNKSGASNEAAGAELKYRRKLSDQEKDWTDLKAKLFETQKKLNLVSEMVEAQKIKFENEKQRHSVGRSTTFIVLQFEQDLASAQLLKLKTKFELLSLLSQAKLYGDTQ